jgi:hypothetical protein
MALWIISYHIEFKMDDGTKITRKDKAREWLSDRYENSSDPMVNMNGLLAGIKNEDLTIDEVILHEFNLEN